MASPEQTAALRTSAETDRQPEPTPVHTGPGWIILFISVFLIGSVFHLIKSALDTCPTSLAITFMCFSATTAMILVGAAARFFAPNSEFASVTPVSIARRLVEQWKWVVPATVVGMTGGWLTTVTIDIYGTSVAAFLNNMTVAFLVLGGVVTGDKLHLKEFSLILLVILGAFLFAYTGESIAWFAMGIMAVACSFTASKQILIKQASMNGNFWDLMAAQQFLMGVWALILSACTGNVTMPALGDGLMLVLSGVIQNFVGMSMLYAGYRIVGVARGAPIYAMRPLVVLLTGLAIGKALPAPVQMVGGVMVLTGSILLASGMGTKRTDSEAIEEKQ